MTRALDIARQVYPAIQTPPRVRRNRFLNSAMMISQENGSTAGTADGFYPVDGWVYFKSHDGTISVAQVAAPTPGGSPNRIRATVTAADTSIAAGQHAILNQRIEGLQVADFQWGTADAKQVVLRLGIKAPAGTYGIGIRNAAAARSFVAEVVIAAGEANTDVVKPVVIPKEVTGTWLKDTGIGLNLTVALAAGSDFQGAAGWQTANKITTANQSNFLATNGNVFELFDVGLYLDADGSGAAPPWELPDFGEELRRCQRYYESAPVFSAIAGVAGEWVGVQWKVLMRAVPTVSFVVNYGTVSNVQSSISGGYAQFSLVTGVGWTANARL